MESGSSSRWRLRKTRGRDGYAAGRICGMGESGERSESYGFARETVGEDKEQLAGWRCLW